MCKLARGARSEGVVEKNVQDSRRRIWIDAGKQRFGSLLELNVWVLARCRELWRELRHPEYGELSVAEMLEHELPHLMPMPTAFDGYVDTLSKVTSTCLVHAARNRYSAPCEFVGQRVSVRLYPERVDLVVADRCVASHLRLSDAGHTGYVWPQFPFMGWKRCWSRSSWCLNRAC